MKKLLLFSLLSMHLMVSGQQGHEYKITAVYHIRSTGGWDYIAVHDGKLYVSHGSQVNIVEEATGDSLGIIADTKGVHGIAFDSALNRGYTSNGRGNNVTVFDLKTTKVIAQISTGENPDFIMYEPFTRTIITCNGRSKNLSIIDPVSNKVTGTIAVGGKPETAVSNEEGKLYVNIEDKNEIVAIDLKTSIVQQHWSLNGAESPTGLAYDKAAKRLFAGCDKLLVVMDADNGKIVEKLTIGEGCDGVVFSSKEKIIYTSNGQAGTMTAIKETSGDHFTILGNYLTKIAARTIALDENNGTLFLPTADFDTNQTVDGRPKIIPGTFQVLVVK